MASDDSRKAADATLCVHPNEGIAPRQGDSVAAPISLSSTYGFRNTAALRDFFEGRVARDEYGRYGSPTVRSAESALARIEHAEEAVLFGSGMAAITTTLLALTKQGDHVVLLSDCYRRTRQFVETELAKFGVRATLVTPGKASAIADAIVPETRVVFLEAPTNPYLRVVDVEAVAVAVRAHRRVKLVVDATFATPFNLRPLELGAHVVIHSATKYLGGHNDLLAGAVLGAGSLMSLVRDARGVYGGVCDPHAAFLLERGIKTAKLRIDVQNASALRLALFLERHEAIERVFYPLLESHPDHSVSARLLRGGGGVVTFLVRGDEARTTAFVDALRFATIAPSLGGVETLVEQPALMSHYELSHEARVALGVPENLVRFSVGVEDAGDLERDLAQALSHV